VERIYDPMALGWTQPPDNDTRNERTASS